MRLFGVVLGLAVSGCVAADLSNRAVFATLTYGTDHTAAPAAQPTFQLFTALQGRVAGPWNDPRAAADCLASLSAQELERIGQATAGQREPSSWAQRLWAELAPVRATPACAAGFASDPVQLAWAVGKSTATITSFARLTWLDAAKRQQTYAQGKAALDRLAEQLRQTPATHTAQASLPTLALSGGAANGAFTAGFLFELMAVRELALAKLPPSTRGEAERGSRFSTLAGSSVGAVLGQLLDLASIEGPLNAEQQAFVEACNALPLSAEPPHGDLTGGHAGCFAGWPSSPFPPAPLLADRPLQTCALKLLQKYFADVDETQLMCAEPGSVLRAVGLLGEPRTNFIRFDPLQRKPLDDVFRLFHQQMQANGLLRVAMSTETIQNQLVAFDERTCGPDGAPACLASGLMSSLVLPVFARPVSHAWTGFTPQGECGVFVDGGLRSVLPALRALSYSRPTPLLPSPTLRVLALDTARLSQLPTPRPKIFVDPLFGTFEQYSTQQDVTELAFAQREAELRDEEIAALLAASSSALPRSLSTPSSDDVRVEGVYVPSDVPEWVVAGAGYSFDRYVMRGLFVWGQHVARARLGSSGRLASRLGWAPALIAELEPVLSSRAQDPDYQQWLSSYSQPVCPAFATWMSEQGRTRISERVELCVEPQKGPAYFSCPAGAWDLGAKAVTP